jgi:hypothetical protein
MRDFVVSWKHVCSLRLQIQLIWSRVHQNCNTFLRNYTASHPRRQYFCSRGRHYFKSQTVYYVIQKVPRVPLATEPGISWIILTPMKILQRNLNSGKFVVWEMKRDVSVVCVCSAPSASLVVKLYNYILYNRKASHRTRFWTSSIRFHSSVSVSLRSNLIFLNCMFSWPCIPV